MQHPLRVVMSRASSHPDHHVLRDVHVMLFRNPRVGELLQIYFDNGSYLLTSKMTSVVQVSDELIVETANSTYRLQPAAN